MSDKIFTVHVAHKKGHKQQLMAREDIVEMVSTNENTWVFVDSQMVSVEELENIELNDATEIRINPGMVGGAETFTVQITDSTGHTVCEMTKEEIATSAKEADNWVFVDGQMVAASAIADTDLSQAIEIRMTRPLVGGL